MPRPPQTKKKVPGVSYAAEEPVCQLFITVRSTKSGTAMRLTYGEWRHGDLPLGGHSWFVEHESPKTAWGVLHLTNLAAWLVRKAVSGQWVQKR